MNGLRISARKEDVYDLLRRIAEYNCTIEGIEHWLKKNVRAI